ncbi:MAG: exo-alpha-sialidase, partial [Verrucomicrobium sp.]
IHLSVDDGKIWSSKRLLEPGAFAYSILARLPDGRVGCLYETGTKHAYEQICLARFDLGWITSPAAAP